MATWATSFWQPIAGFRDRREKSTATTAAVVDEADPFMLTGIPNDDVYLYCKRIDNTRLVRQADTQVKGEWSAIAGVCTAALLIGGMMIAPGVATIMDSYKIQDLKREQVDLRNQLRRLDVDTETYLNTARLDMLAKQQNLQPPDKHQVVRLQPKTNHALAMNALHTR